MQNVSYITSSADQTQRLGKLLAAELRGGEVISLIGDLGGGKTTFVQGLASGLKIDGNITSPTFLIFKKYRVKSGKVKYLYHFDLYRISNVQEIVDLGFEEIISSPENLAVVEWAGKIKTLLANKNNIKVNFKYIGKNKRQITFSS